MIEIYNEHIIDSLDINNNNQNLEIRENKNK